MQDPYKFNLGSGKGQLPQSSIASLSPWMLKRVKHYPIFLHKDSVPLTKALPSQSSHRQKHSPPNTTRSEIKFNIGELNLERTHIQTTSCGQLYYLTINCVCGVYTCVHKRQKDVGCPALMLTA